MGLFKRKTVNPVHGTRQLSSPAMGLKHKFGSKMGSIKTSALEPRYSLKNIISSVFSVVFAVSLIVTGASLIGDEKLINTNLPEQASQFNYGMGVTMCVIGSIIVLYGLIIFIKHLLGH